jgi:hypothetical protein
MDKKTKILSIIFIAAIMVSAFATYYKVIIKNDFIISGEAECDPKIEKCFARPCGSENECDNSGAKFSYYKIINKNFKDVACGPNNENCSVLECEEGDKNCEEILCDENNIGEGEECNDPSAHNMQNTDESAY